MRKPCSLGVGCEESGVCYAAAHGRPEECGRSDSDEPIAEGLPAALKPVAEDDYYGSPAHSVFGDEWLYRDYPGAW